MVQKIRKPKTDDDDTAKRATKILVETIELNNHIEPNIYVDAMYYLIATTYANSGLTFDIFKKEVEHMLSHYKPIFDK